MCVRACVRVIVCDILGKLRQNNSSIVNRNCVCVCVCVCARECVCEFVDTDVLRADGDSAVLRHAHPHRRVRGWRHQRLCALHVKVCKSLYRLYASWQFSFHQWDE